MSDSHEPSLGRRAFARLAIWGAAGLSLIPGCLPRRGGTDVGGDVPAKIDDSERASLLARWARLGDVWRKMNALSTSATEQHTDAEDRHQRFYALRDEMGAALDDLPAWRELRYLSEERARHMDHYELGVFSTCYEYAGPVCEKAGKAVAEQVTELARLVSEGKLTTEAASRAARALAVHAEFMGYVYADLEEDDDGWVERWHELEPLYEAGTLEPAPRADLAAMRTVELTVDKLGWLAGPPQENEGFQDASAADKEDDQ